MRPWLVPADALLQQAAWWFAVVLAGRGHPALAAAGGVAAVVAHLALRGADRARVARCAIGAALFGLATDSALSAAGLATFAGGGPLAPAWMVGLWAAFGAALTASLARASRWSAVTLAAAAAAAGPLAYRAGAALGAISLDGGAALGAIAAQWAAGVPLLARLARPRAPTGSAPVGACGRPSCRP